MKQLNKIQEFILFVMEAYKNKNKLTGEGVLNVFQEYNIFDYLENGYEVLHTQSLDYVVFEITEMIKSKK
jgi:hypothetical protein